MSGLWFCLLYCQLLWHTRVNDSDCWGKCKKIIFHSFQITFCVTILPVLYNNTFFYSYTSIQNINLECLSLFIWNHFFFFSTHACSRIIQVFCMFHSPSLFLLHLMWSLCCRLCSYEAECRKWNDFIVTVTEWSTQQNKADVFRSSLNTTSQVLDFGLWIHICQSWAFM